jgi:hypothetical protein
VFSENVTECVHQDLPPKSCCIILRHQDFMLIFPS